MSLTTAIRAPRGTTITCKGWHQEAALRMIHNNLDPEVAEKPDELIVYGGTGRAARDWPSFHAIVRSLQSLENDETLLVQSGTPGRHLPHASRSAARPDRQFEPGGPLVELRGIHAARKDGAHDVRPDDRRLVDLHRQPGYRARHIRNVRRGCPQAFRRIAQRQVHRLGRHGRDGRRPAARRYHERRPLPGHRRRSAAHPAPRGDRLLRPHGAQPR